MERRFLRNIKIEKLYLRIVQIKTKEKKNSKYTYSIIYYVFLKPTKSVQSRLRCNVVLFEIFSIKLPD